MLRTSFAVIPTGIVVHAYKSNNKMLINKTIKYFHLIDTSSSSSMWMDYLSNR